MNQREIILVQWNGNLTDIFRCFNYFKTSGISLEVPNDLEIKIKLLNNLILAKEEQEKFFLTEMSDNFLQCHDFNSTSTKKISIRVPRGKDAL